MYHVFNVFNAWAEKELFSSMSKACQLFLYLLICLLDIIYVNISLSQCCSGLSPLMSFLNKSVDVVRKMYSLSLHLRGQSSVNYFQKLVSIILYKALNIMGCMPLVHCFPKSQLQTYGLSPHSCNTFTPQCLWPSGNLLQSYFSEMSWKWSFSSLFFQIKIIFLWLLTQVLPLFPCLWVILIALCFLSEMWTFSGKQKIIWWSRCKEKWSFILLWCLFAANVE